MTITRKNLLLLTILAAVVLTAASEILSQRKFISESEYHKGLYGDYEGEPRGKRPVRTQTLRETLDNVIVTKAVYLTSEVVPDGPWRTFEKVVEIGKTTETESILINNFLYKRTDGGAWSKEYDRSLYLWDMEAANRNPGDKCTQNSVEIVDLNGVAMKLFETVVVQSGADGLEFSEKRTWIGAGGLRYRVEEVSGRLSPRVETSRRVSVYEYPSELKIEAPVDSSAKVN